MYILYVTYKPITIIVIALISVLLLFSFPLISSFIFGALSYHFIVKNVAKIKNFFSVVLNSYKEIK